MAAIKSFVAILCVLAYSKAEFLTSIEKFEHLKSHGIPFLETYWESYLSWPYNYNNCAWDDLNPNDIDETAFGYDLSQIPTDSIKVLSIAFAEIDTTK
jgi:hypothetical protein